MESVEVGVVEDSAEEEGVENNIYDGGTMDRDVSNKKSKEDGVNSGRTQEGNFLIENSKEEGPKVISFLTNNPGGPVEGEMGHVGLFSFDMACMSLCEISQNHWQERKI